MSIGRPLRATAVLLAALTAVFGVALASPAAAAPTIASDDDAASVAAGWLARQLVDGDHFEAEFGGQKFPDQGLTADAVLAFDAADVAQTFAAAATDWLAGPEILSGYAGDGVTEFYPGALAKLALVAQAQGQDPHEFGGVDLVERLRSTEGTREEGRFSDRSQFFDDDFSNGITQSLAIIALLRDGDSADDLAKPVDFLAGSQCSDGGFPLLFGQQTCASDVDTTSFVIQALLAAERDAPASDALDFLEGVQDAGGGFGGSGPTSGLNSNSTGLAAQALRVGGRDDAAEAAVEYLLGLQVGCDGPADQRGAIAYDATGFAAGTAVRATTQAAPGLAGTGLFTVGNEGDATAAPELDCTPETTTPSTTTPAPTTVPATTTAPPAQGIGSGAAELPATGAPTAPAAALGVLLVLAGTGALLLARRRRAAGEGP